MSERNISHSCTNQNQLSVIALVDHCISDEVDELFILLAVGILIFHLGHNAFDVELLRHCHGEYWIRVNRDCEIVFYNDEVLEDINGHSSFCFPLN